MKTKISFAITLLAIIGLTTVFSCSKESEPIEELNQVQKQFYSNHKSFLDQFEEIIIKDWIKQIEFDQKTGEMMDSKVLLLEDYLTDEQIDDFLIELYASDEIPYLIIHDDHNDKSERILKNPKFNRNSLEHNTSKGSETTHIWKRKRNNELGGCDFKWSSICVIRAETTVFH
mgnify:CR=1 FL=1